MDISFLKTVLGCHVCVVNGMVRLQRVEQIFFLFSVR